MIATFARPKGAYEEPGQLWLAAGVSVAAVLAVALAARGGAAGAIVLVALGGGALVALTIWRPAIGCAVLVLSVPLTGGLGRDTVIPLFRTSEVIAALVGLALLVRYVPKKSRIPFTGLDLAVGGYCLSGLIIPALVLFVGHDGGGFTVWRVVFAPAQYLLIYLIFSRTELRERSLYAILNLAMAASVVIALIGLAQLADVPGVRTFINSYFPMDGSGEAICQFGVCRPDSLLEHWSAFGGFALLNFILALALAAWAHPAFSKRWLTLVMAANAVAVLASQTQAVIIALVIVILVVIWHARRAPRQLLVVAAAILVGLAVFWPQVSARATQQFSSVASGSSGPVSLETRFRYWNAYFLPVIGDHLLTGTGTVIPGAVPTQLASFVDNEYLRLAFRAGVVGVGALLLMLATVGAVGWRNRMAPDPTVRAIGATAVAYVIGFAIMGATGEYLTYAGLSQLFWMVIGVLGALQLARLKPLAEPARIIELSPAPQWGGPIRIALSSAARSAMRLAPEMPFLRSSAIVFSGNTAARFLGLLFSVVAARLLLPAGYGIFAYALALATIAGMLVGNAQQGLSRALARSEGAPAEQNAHFTNWVVVVAIVLGLSLAIALPLSYIAGLRGWLVVGVMANLVGLAVLQLYREAQRGLERYGAMVGVYLLANVIQLLAIIGLAVGGQRSPAAYLIVYGLSSVVGLMPMQAMAPLTLHFVRDAVSRVRIQEIRKFISPLFLQTAFFSIWIGADLILVTRLMSSSSAGAYAAAKTVVNGLMLIATAITVPLVPRVANLPARAVAEYVLRALRIVAVLTVPLVAFLVLFSRPLVSILFASGYAQAAAPLAILAIGMGLYALYTVLEWAWIARGRPAVDATATGAGMLTTVVAGLMLVPRAGLVGAAIAFAAGAAIQLVVIGGISAWWLQGIRRVPDDSAERSA
ncbi:MAG TPA: oligosaccharide flippase family protein [Candidatus Dormibacteraeota bacterium]|nr:oligosaccharide flippase family protein [Candidatus Dormibacteraeota bacterium]